MRRGTYLQGFAPRDFRPMHPELWRGCVGAWCPSLGPTGVTLYDWSARKNNGTLTGMTLSTAWDVRSGYQSIASTATNGTQCITLGAKSELSISGAMTVSTWFRPAAVASNLFITGASNAGLSTIKWDLEHGRNGSGSVGLLWLTASGFAGWYTGSGVIANSVLYHIAVTRNEGGTLAQVYIDGKAVTTSLLGSLPNSGNASGGTVDAAILRLGAYTATSATGSVMDQMLYGRVLTPNEIATLALHPGIAYTPARRRVYQGEAAGNRRRRVIIGSAA